ncbi:hypothetical protein BV898_17717 [Hypsibius exemplaris]|uniref:Uncharacterized protein n=1 Tax=Hypsibius exemplaris TaxID=2072580 RepID=A0A9X6RME7_HYPEX|nr:hypothetical protein BV898_17717 [Hypsibius exemplaris]
MKRQRVDNVGNQTAFRSFTITNGNGLPHSTVPGFSFDQLMSYVDPHPEVTPNAWRKALDRPSQMAFYYQLDLRCETPSIVKAVRVRPEKIENGQKSRLIPTVFIRQQKLAASYVQTVLGKSHLGQIEDLIRLLEHVGAIVPDSEETEEENGENWAPINQSIDQAAESSSEGINQSIELAAESSSEGTENGIGVSNLFRQVLHTDSNDTDEDVAALGVPNGLTTNGSQAGTFNSRGSERERETTPDHSQNGDGSDGDANGMGHGDRDKRSDSDADGEDGSVASTAATKTTKRKRGKNAKVVKPVFFSSPESSQSRTKQHEALVTAPEEQSVHRIRTLPVSQRPEPEGDAEYLPDDASSSCAGSDDHRSTRRSKRKRQQKPKGPRVSLDRASQDGSTRQRPEPPTAEALVSLRGRCSYLENTLDRLQFHLKNPAVVPPAYTSMFDVTSPWYFEEAGPDKVELHPGTNIYVDNGCLELVAHFVELGVNRYVWFLMQRVLGGEGGVRRLASIKEMEILSAEVDGKRSPKKFCERILGPAVFSALETHVRTVISTTRGGDPSNMPPSLAGELGFKLDDWMRKQRERWGKK